MEKDHSWKRKKRIKRINYNIDDRRAHTKNNEIILHKDDHNHDQYAAQVGVKKYLSQVREIVSNQIEATPRQIISQVSCSSRAIFAA